MATAIQAHQAGNEQERHECPVCMEDIAGGQLVRPPCGHLICHPCCQRIQTGNNLCPLCRGRYPTRLEAERTNVDRAVARSVVIMGASLTHICSIWVELCRVYPHLPAGIQYTAERNMRNIILDVGYDFDNIASLMGDIWAEGDEPVVPVPAPAVPQPAPVSGPSRRCPGCSHTRTGVRLVRIPGLSRRVYRCQQCHH